MRAAALLLAVLPLLSFAQYSGPAVESCRSYAEAEAKKSATGTAAVRFDRDQELVIERYTRKLGSQFVSSLLTGNGAIVHSGGAAIEMSFLCLLADERRAVFFFWRPRRDAPVLAHCLRGAQTAQCLETLLLLAEQDLTQIYARHYVEAREADAKAGNEDASNAFRRSAEAFRAYRDAECARRGAAQSEPRRACMVELTRRRALELR